MKILITGATGFIGRNLVKVLSQSNDVHILVRPSSDYAFLDVKNVFVFDDNIEELGSYLNAHKIDGVIHLASLYLAEHNCQQIKSLILSNIYLGTALLEACKMADIKWFLNTGTIWQNYNAPDYSDEYNPVNLYAASKQAFMTMAKYYSETSKIHFCTLKLCDTYGPNDTRKKIFTLFEEVARTGKSLDMSPGEQLIDIMHINDVVEGFINLIEKLQRGEKLRPEYVLSSGRRISLRDLAKQYENVHNVKLNINWGGRPYRKREVMQPYIGNILTK